MGIENIREAVISEARKEAEHIVESTKSHFASLMSKKKEEIASDFDRLYKARSSAIADEFNRKLIRFKGIAGKQILERRNNLLNNLFEKAKEQILGLSPEKYGLFITGLIEKAAGTSGGLLRIHMEEKDIFMEVLSHINKMRGPDTYIFIDESNPLTEKGGFVFIGKDYEVEQTLGLLLRDLRQEMLPEIAKELFSVQS